MRSPVAMSRREGLVDPSIQRIVMAAGADENE